MFTVILLSDRAQARFDQWSVLFEPYVRAGQVEFCEWNQGPSVTRLSQAVPRLAEAITGHQEWRLMVVDAEPTEVEGAHATDPANPFDFLDNMGIDPRTGRPREELALDDSPHPSIRLAHMLLGYPEMGPRAFVADPSYWDTERGLRVYESEYVEEQLGRGVTSEEASARFRAALVTGRDVQVHYRELEYSEDERLRHEELVKRYRVRHNRPSEVLFISTREPILANPTDDLREMWDMDVERGPSRFIERNDWPASCRFGVFDLRSRDHADFELDELRFWLSILSIAVNDLPPSSFQAERLYRIGVDFDHERMGSLLNNHLGLLATAREHVDGEIRQPSRVSDTTVKDILRPRKIHVAFDDLNGDELSVSTSGYSLASDSPRSESSRWEGSLDELKQHADVFVRRPRRVLARAVEETRHEARSYPEDNNALSSIEKEELRDELTKRTRRLTQPATADILNRARLERLISDHDKQIRGEIASRMKSRTIGLALLVVLGIWIACFLPYLVQEAARGGVALAESLTVVLVTLGVVVGIAVAVLFYMRARLLAMIRSMNSALKAFTLSVSSGANEFTSYLSELATYMYGRSVLISASRQEEKQKSHLLGLSSLRRKILEAMDREKRVLHTLGVPLNMEFFRAELSEIRAAGDLTDVFQWPLGQRRALLNNSGETIAAPYDFVQRLNVERVTLHERSHMIVRDSSQSRNQGPS